MKPWICALGTALASPACGDRDASGDTGSVITMTADDSGDGSAGSGPDGDGSGADSADDGADSGPGSTSGADATGPGDTSDSDSGPGDTTSASTSSDDGTTTGGQVPCDPGYIRCDGTCIHPGADENYCGASGDCTGPNAGQACTPDEECRAGTCSAAKSWGTPTLLETETSSPWVMNDAQGNVMVVFLKPDNGFDSVMARRFTIADGQWGPTEILDSKPDCCNMFGMHASGSGGGDVVATWIENDGGTNLIWANHYDASAGAWDGAVMIDDDLVAIQSYTPKAALDDAGNAFVLWYGDTGGLDYSFSLARFDAVGGSWEPAFILQPDQNTAFHGDPALVMAPSGDAAVLWADIRDGELSVHAYAQYYDHTVGSWGAVEDVDPNESSIDEPIGTIDGNDIVTGFYYDYNYGRVQHTRRDATGTWTPIEAFFPIGLDEYPHAAADALGNVILVWHRVPTSDPYEDEDIYVARYDAASDTWSGPDILDGSPRNSERPMVAIDAQGYAVAMWHEYAAEDVNLSFYDAALDTWGPSFQLPGGLGSDSGRLTMDPMGNVTVVFTPDSANDLYAIRYD